MNQPYVSPLSEAMVIPWVGTLLNSWGLASYMANVVTKRHQEDPISTVLINQTARDLIQMVNRPGFTDAEELIAAAESSEDALIMLINILEEGVQIHIDQQQSIRD